MGLATTKALVSQDSWTVHIIDVNPAHLSKVSKSSANVTAHQADVTDYSQLSDVFQKVHESHQRLDFVFANAGIVESTDFYEHQKNTPPPPPIIKSIDVNLNGVVLTSYLAQHYFRQSSHYGKGTQSLVLTASCGALYPSHYSPLYTASKHGVLGLGRAIAKHLFREGIRVNVICPGVVDTNLTSWAGFPPQLFTPAEQISKAVAQLVDAREDLVDANGRRIPVDQLYGLAVEVNVNKIYVREIPEFCDEEMKTIMGFTDPGNREGLVIKKDG
ncbi:hypothetical protein CERZMDRAFT_37692 [Cercospora zeae-maydis SCOH1-5]|uniref:Uncharacterized protein n=1 Tax=Cercospora zeae-maydis SCOH1-5 TaxID=717836 RepID=A0A6A6FLT0_9PEZI|nr:hypothetical protein CERZMDRAFT_37692 [Cercospora zeae-maydis SCOH1-5]